jgi:hypothetical protein
MQLVQESLLEGTQFTHEWGKNSVKRTRVDQAKTTRTEQTTNQQTKRSRTEKTTKQPIGQTTKQPTGRTTKQPTGQTTKQPTETSRFGGHTTKQPTATTRCGGQTPKQPTANAATREAADDPTASTAAPGQPSKNPSEKTTAPGTRDSADCGPAPAATDRVRRGLLRVGDLGVEVGASAGIHQANELGMKSLSLGAQQLKILAKVAKQRRDRGRHLVGGRWDDPGRGAGDRSRGLGQGRADTCQILGRTLNQVRRRNDIRHGHSPRLVKRSVWWSELI